MESSVENAMQTRNRGTNMKERRPLIAGNWKMNGLVVAGTQLDGALVGRIAEDPRIVAELLIGLQATLIAPVGDRLRGTPIRLGGRVCQPDAGGAPTGCRRAV